MNKLFKYPRTQHISGSKLQIGDYDLKTVDFSFLENKNLVIEEKIDGANCGLSFNKNGDIRLQSRGHYLTGGYRERHFNLYKSWATAFSKQLYGVLGSRYIMYGEWLYAKHTVFYDQLPHYFFEFDLLDLEKNCFLSTEERQKLLKTLPFIVSVPVLKTGVVNSFEQLKSYLVPSLYKSEHWKKNLEKECLKSGLSYDKVLNETDQSQLAEGLYIKWEENGEVKGRYKYVRQEFIAQILSSDSHWLDRPIIQNQLQAGASVWI